MQSEVRLTCLGEGPRTLSLRVVTLDREVVVSAEVWEDLAHAYYKLWQKAEKELKRLDDKLFDAHYLDLDD